MRISRIRSQILVMPQQDPLANTPEDTSAARPIVILRLNTDDGIEGIGVTFYGGAVTASLKRAVDDLGALIIGDDPLRVEAIIAKLRAAAGGSGPAGIFTLALSAIDIGKRVEDAGVGLFWLEDVTTADDFAGLARVTAALSTPVAGGEYVWGIVPFRHMVEARSVDIVMIDLVRVGGITQWMKVAGMAEAFNLPVVSHLIPEVHVHLIGAVPNGLTVEYMPWLMRLFEEVPRPQNGELVMPTAPGLGLKFDQATLDRYRAA